MSPAARTRLLFGSALAFLVLSGLSTFFTVSRLRSAQGWAIHTREVQAALAEVNTVFSRAGRTRAQYLESGDPQRLEECQQALAQIRPALASLQQLTNDNAPQQNKLAELGELADRRISLMQRSLALKAGGRSNLETQAQFTTDIVSVAGQMDSLVQRMQAQEQLLLERRTNRWRDWEQTAGILLALTFLIAAVLFVLHYRLLSKELAGRQNAEAALRKLSARLLQIQDEERRKFSRELHDSLGQYLAAAKMSLESLSGRVSDPRLTDCVQLLDQAVVETRTISHLLHPPLLDETGFASAARWYVDGFSKRSGIQAKLDIPQPFDRLSGPIELVMFRVLQESLTNIHRHSRGSQTEVSVNTGPSGVILTIRDNGQGMPPTVLNGFRTDGVHLGVGLAGMRERVRELGGHLEIRSDGTGTVVSAFLPKTPAAAHPAQAAD